MGKARNLSVLLAADGQVEDAKIDGVSSSKLSGALPAISAENLTSIPAGELTGTISDSRLSTASQVAKLPLSGGTMTGNIVMGDDTSIGIGDSAERIEFDGAGDIGFLGCNVGISRSNPDARLELTSNSNGGILVKPSEQIANTPSSLGNFRQGITFENSGSSHAFSIGYGQGAKIKFNYYDGSSTFSEIASISSTGTLIIPTGNVLVGKTSAGYANTGHQLNGAGSYAAFTRDGGTPVLINRKTNDGDIIEFMKDGTTVGNIGVTSSDQFYIARTTSNQGIKFKNSATMPCTSSGNDADNAQDLGSSSVRWKDIYLSGGLLVGGTGTANTMDDYEEGGWTPVLSDGTNNASTYATNSQIGIYTKIGRIVHASGYLMTSNIGSVSGSIRITGLPFTIGSGSRAYYAAGSVAWAENHVITAGETISILGIQGQSYVRVELWDSTGGITNMQSGEWSSDGQISFTLTYST